MISRSADEIPDVMEEFEEFIPGDRADWLAICDAVIEEDRSEQLDGMVAQEPQASYSGSPLYRDNLLLKETFELSVRTIRFVNQLGCERAWLIDQFERSACSPGANSKEAQNAESLKDFVHKLKIALKEADEAEYWYYLIAATHDKGIDEDLIARIQRVMRILNKILGTSKQRLLSRKNTK
ncbi:MAG: four helix bundle protein [Flavobacteriales bacterium]|nr:MAG: four helix bundle protein [Flavobacteriales bacterium]